MKATIVVFVWAISLAAIPSKAKTVIAPGNDNDRVVNTVSGVNPSRTPADAQATKQPSKKQLKKAKVAPKPPMTDPN